MATKRKFPEEMFKRGEPSLRPAYGRGVLTRTPTMSKLEKQWRGYALLATIEGQRPPVSPEDMLAVLEAKCEVKRRDVKIEVCAPPADFFLQFRSMEDCTKVVHLSGSLVCCGETVRFRRWHRSHSATKSELLYPAVVSFDNFPREAWEPEAVGKFINLLGGHVDELLPAMDGWRLGVLAWMKDPSSVPKLFSLEIPETDLVPSPPYDPDGVHTPSPPSSPTKKRTSVYNIIVHVEEVTDRGPIMTEGTQLYDDDYRNTKRTHRFPTWSGRVDGRGPPTMVNGGHCFAGPSGKGKAGGKEQ